MGNSIIKALGIMFKAHRGQKDKSGKPYCLHPMYVALKCKGEEERITALLHDTIEDGGVTIPELRAKGFSQEIIEAVDCLTHRPYVDYMTYIEIVKGNPLARAVKLRDLEHNMSTKRLKHPDEVDFKRLEKYRRAYEFLK